MKKQELKARIAELEIENKSLKEKYLNYKAAIIEVVNGDSEGEDNPELIGTTVDGVDIYGGYEDVLYFFYKGTGCIGNTLSSIEKEYFISCDVISGLYSTKEACEKDRDLSRIKFTTADGMDIKEGEDLELWYFVKGTTRDIRVVRTLDLDVGDEVESEKLSAVYFSEVTCRKAYAKWKKGNYIE